MSYFSRDVVDAALNRIEEIEHTSLVWGSVDGGFDRDQLAAELIPILQKKGHPDPDDGAEDLIEELLDKALVCECRTLSGKAILRSRFAEGVRLLSRLRQLFPKRD